jgi:glycosyltransferase involved in cell wall biosynthesis
VASVVYHDYFPIRGGGERVALELAHGFDADLVYAFRTHHSYPVSEFPANHRSLGVDGVARQRGIAAIALALAFTRERRRAAGYDVRFFSGITSPFAAPAKSLPGRNIFYCHTPPRFLFDLRDRYLDTSGPLRRLGMKLLGPTFLRGYERAVDRMHVIVANSENVHRRIKTYLGRESVVVYPPVDTEGFAWGEPQGYYLSTGRLAPLKRIGLIVDAFLKMPHKRLVVASGGEEEAALRARAAGAPNISFTGWTDEAQLRTLMAGAIATIYIPVDEDFGMSPVESMAAGKPVIGVAEGGLLETIVPRETGILIGPTPTVDDLIAAVEELDEDRALQLRSACEGRARLFTRERFLSAMRALIES